MGPRLLRALLHRAAADPPDPDTELLRKFAATGDEPAFAELVRRYGGLVWGQCRNMLPSEADAEDAFQATFLVLARRPGAIRSAVGPYLHGVAYRVCLNARRLAGRRKKREAGAAVPEAERPVAESAWDAALATVHDELHRLPDPQREAFVLCVLEGRELTDAAGHLGVKLGTLSARLSRAKQALMDRVAAKGVVAGIAAVASLAPAGVSAAATAKAVEVAIGSVSGSAVVPQTVLALTHGVARMVTSKLKLLAAGVLLACGLGLTIGTGLVASAQDPKPKTTEPRAEETKTAREPRPAEARAERELAKLDGTWLVVSIEHESVKAPASQTDGNTWTFAKGTLVSRTTDPGKGTDHRVEWKVRFETAGERKALVLSGQHDLRAIYLLDGDDLVVCGGKERPDDFTTGGDGSGRMAWVLKRKKEPETPTAILRERLRKAEVEYERLIAQERLVKEEAERQLRARWDQLAAERDRLVMESKQLRDKEAQLQAEIDALKERMKQQPAKPVAPPPAGANAKPEKMFDVNFDKVLWPNVIDWLAKELSLTVVGNEKPEGICTIKLGRKVTAGELVDIINEMLAQQKRILIRAEQTLRLWPADKPLPQLFVQSVAVEDLPKFGKSEVVRVVVPLDGVAAGAEVVAKKLLSPFGEVVLIGQKQLVIQDRAGEVRAILAAVRK